MALLGRPARRPLGAVLAALLAALIALSASAPPSSAQVVEVGGAKFGLRDRSVELSDGVGRREAEALGGTPGYVGLANPTGGQVLPTSKVYAVYWDPGYLYHADWQRIVNGFFSNMAQASGGLGNAFAVDAQYTDAAGQHAATSTSFEGAYTDTSPYPTSGCNAPQPAAVACLTDAQLRAQLEAFVAGHGLPRGTGAVYYVLTPPGVTDCLEGGSATRCSVFSGAAEQSNASFAGSFCSYHSYIEPPGVPADDLLYAAIPWVAGNAGNAGLPASDPTTAYACQDGGWEPTAGAPPAEQREKTPVVQEPNQIGLGLDGTYDTGLADLIVGQIATEQQDIATDPLLASWQNRFGEEVGEICQNFYAPATGSAAPQAGTEAGSLFTETLGGGAYYLNDAFNLAAAKLSYPGVTCLKGTSLAPSFSGPTDANAGEIVGFDGMESNITLDAGTAYEGGKAKTTYPVYEWSFGDGTTAKGFAPGASSSKSPSEASLCEEPWIAPCAGAVFHTYAYGGTYDVTLTVTDVGGHTASVTEPIVVSGPAPPPKESSGGAVSAPQPGAGAQSRPAPGSTPPPSTNAGSAGGGSKGTNAGKSGKRRSVPLAKPKLSAIVVTKKTKALMRGLKVRFQVNEQAAGRFEVLIPTALAKRLRLRGANAGGLPKGSKPETVLAHALLETTRSARRTVEISIPKRSAQRLAKLAKLTLILRVSARDASSSHPQLAVLTTVAKLTR
ncbi:MAG: PKD domain-containing protein [Solirubrobacteraceae bacterium]